MGCVFRDKLNYCHALNSTTFINHSCPFAKTKEQLLKELHHISERNGYTWTEYKEHLKEVFDVNVYKRLFGDEE